MESHGLDLAFELTPPAPSSLQQSKRDTEAQDSYWAHHPSISSFPTIKSPGPCTFVFPSRKRPSYASLLASNTLKSAKLAKEAIIDSATLSPDYNAGASPSSSTSQEPAAGLSESSSGGTFGGSSLWGVPQIATVSSPDTDNFHRALRQRSPLNQLFAPPILSTPMIECLSDSSVDGTTLLTPTEGPFSTDALRAGDGATELTSSSTRASLFTISAYNRMDNMKTPLVDTEHAVHGATKPPRRVSFLGTDHASAYPAMPYTSHFNTLTSASSSSMRRTHRPASLTLGQDIAYLSQPIVARNVSQGTSGSVGDTSSDHSSIIEENPVRRVISRGTTRYNQVLTAPPLPVVEAVKRVCVELRIDQEEHRTIRPQFMFKRHIAKPMARPRSANPRPSTASKGPDAFWDNVTASGLVDFRMSAREVGTFHCGTTYREAVLRRVIVDKEDHKDHLTANVVLPLKENGVYTVHGIERERKKINSQILVWKFEYTVEDKRQTGKLLTGEKLLRPISFICSPELLLPSQASAVTIMHLLSKKIALSPTATRIPPPAMAVSLPLSTTSAAFKLSDTRSSPSRKRKSRIVTAVRSLSRPTTPARDPRLHDGLDPTRTSFRFSRRASIARSHRSERTANGSGLLKPSIASSTSLSQPISRRSNAYNYRLAVSSPHVHTTDPHPHQWPQKWTMSLGKSVDSLPLSASSIHQRPHTTDSSLIRRPRTAGFALGKSLKHMSGAFAGKMTSRNRPATAGSQFMGTAPSQPPRLEKSSFRLTFSPMNNDIRKGEAGVVVAPEMPVWQMPADGEIDDMLERAERFVMVQQYRLDILARSRNSRDTSIEWMDSSGDITLQSESSSPPQKPRHHFTGQPIASPRTLQNWARPGSAPSRASTAKGTPTDVDLSHPPTSRSLSQAILRRPHTSDGSNQDTTSPASYSRSRNGSAMDLGLPHPPRKPRGSLGKTA